MSEQQLSSARLSPFWYLASSLVLGSAVIAVEATTVAVNTIADLLRLQPRTTPQSRSKSATITRATFDRLVGDGERLATMADTLSPWKEEPRMMLPPGGKPTMAGLPLKTPEQIEAERNSYKHVTAWLRWRQQRRYVGRDNDAHLVTVWASSIAEIYTKYGELIHEVYEADDGKYQYTHLDWAVLLEEAWDSGQVGVDNSESPWYNLLNGQKGSNEK